MSGGSPGVRGRVKGTSALKQEEGEVRFAKNEVGAGASLSESWMFLYDSRMMSQWRQ